MSTQLMRNWVSCNYQTRIRKIRPTHSLGLVKTEILWDKRCTCRLSLVIVAQMRKSDGNEIFSSSVSTFGHQNRQAEMVELLRRISVKPNVIGELSKTLLGWVDRNENMLLWTERVDFWINQTDNNFHRRLQILQMITKIIITPCLARCLDPLG